MKITKIKGIVRLYKVFILVISPFLMMWGNEIVVSVFALLNCSVLTLNQRNNRLLFYALAMLSFFSINFVNSMVFDTSTTIFVNNLNNTECLLISLKCFYLFVSTLLIILKKSRKVDLELRFNNFNNRSLFFYAICFLIVIFAILGFDRTASAGYTNHISTMYELTYFLLFFAMLLSDKKKGKVIPLVLISLFIIAQDLLFGGRITSLQICLVFFAFFADRIKLKHIVMISVAGVMFLLVGGIRDGNALSLGSFNIFKIDTFYMAFEASETHVYCQNVLPLILRLGTFWGNLLNTFFINVGTNYNVSAICDRIIHNNGGGFCFTHTYFWFGYLGPILYAVLIAIVLNNCNKHQNIYSKIIYAFFLITLPRWYAYEPFILIKFGFIWNCIICYVLNICQKRKSI